MKLRIMTTAASIAALASTFCGGAAFAQQDSTVAQSGRGGMGEVVVTARRKNEQLQRVPVAVTVLTPEIFTSKGTYSPLSLAKDAPGLQAITTTSSGDTFFYAIRGQNQTSFTLFPAVIPYFAETPISRGLAEGQFFDLENVQVLRGAQGVRFGRVTDGGAVLISPKRPTDDFGGYVQGKLGDYRLRGVEGALNIPIVKDKVLLRASIDVTRRDGYTRNLVNNSLLDDVNYDTGRLSLILRPIEKLENYTTAQYQYIDTNGTSEVLAQVWPGTLAASVGMLSARALQQSLGIRAVYNNSLAYGPDAGMGIEQKSLLLSNITTYDLTDNISLKNIFGYSTFIQNQRIDNDGSILPIIDAPSRFGPLNQQHQWTEEFQIRGSLFDEALDWTIGVYADSQKPTRFHALEVVQFFTVDSVQGSDAFTTSRAIYGSGEYNLDWLLKGLKINGGVRYTKDKSKGAAFAFQQPFPNTVPVPNNACAVFVSPFGVQTCSPFKQESTATTWEAGATWQATNDLFLYATGRTGYRPGGANTSSSLAAFAVYQPEDTTEVELGAKVDWRPLGMRARSNIALFHDRLKDLQKVESPLVNGTQQSLVINAIAGTVQGLEIENKLIPFEGMTIGLNYAYLDAQFDKDPSLNAALFSPVDGICNNSTLTPSPVGALGFCPYNAFKSAPKHTATLTIDYTLPLPEEVGAISIGGDLQYVTKMANNDANFGDPFAFNKPHAEVNLRASWKDMFGHPVDAGFFVTNVTDISYYQGGIPLAKLGYDAMKYNPPRMYGFTLKYRFGNES